MAELDIGQHCSQPECKQLDFLPITCSGCGSIFCKDHSFREHHNCPHDETVDKEYTGPKSYKCGFENCTNRELTPIVCSDCSSSFCLQHRHAVDHRCPKLVTPEPRMVQTAQHVQDILSTQAAKQPVKRKKISKKARATAAKVALMKLKMKSSGTKGIPESERTYLLIYLPKGSKAATIPMYFSRLWSVGRVVDAIADSASLRNENHVGGARRLRLFETSEGARLDTEAPLGGYLDHEVIYNGGDAILEYVDDDSVTSLENFLDYK